MKPPQFMRDPEGRVWVCIVRGPPLPENVRWVCATDPRLVALEQPLASWKPARPRDRLRCARVAGVFYDADRRRMLCALVEGYTHLTLSSTAHRAGQVAATFRRRMRSLLWAVRPDERRWYFDWKAERWAIFDALGMADIVKAEWRARRGR